MEFTAVDVAKDPAGMDELRALGALMVPVVAVGGRWVPGGVLDEVAKFLGLEQIAHPMLAPDVLSVKLDEVMAAAQRYILAFPRAKMGMTVPGREKRDMRELSYHIFAIPIDFITVKDGEHYTQGNKPIPESVQTPEQIAAYGDEARRTMKEWFAAQPDATWNRMLSTSYGNQNIHHYFERSTWHAAQHVRQLAAMLEMADGQVPDKLPESFFEGLPLPERLWE